MSVLKHDREVYNNLAQLCLEAVVEPDFDQWFTILFVIIILHETVEILGNLEKLVPVHKVAKLYKIVGIVNKLVCVPLRWAKKLAHEKKQNF